MKKPNRYILPAITAFLLSVLVILAIVRNHPMDEVHTLKVLWDESAPIGYRININQASAEELMQLPGIGPTLSKRIIEYRKLYGPYENIFDLKKVPGISEDIFAEIKSYITI